MLMVAEMAALAVGVALLGPIGGALLAGAVGLVGNLLVNALVGPPKPQGSAYLTRPPAFTISGGTNVAAPLSPIPKIYGTRQISPELAGSPYIEQIGENQFLRMLFLLGYGPLDINTVKIQNTDIEAFKSLQWEWRAGFPDDEPVQLYPGSVVTQSLNIQLSQGHLGNPPTLFGWQQQTSGTGADELAVWISFPAGFDAYGKSDGIPVPIQAHIQIQWRLTGTSGAWNVEPQIVFHKGSPGDTFISHSWKVPRGQYDVQVQIAKVVIYKNDWSNAYTAAGYWTELDTIRDQPPVTMSGLSLLAIRIRASGQLNGVINSMQMIASSILPDYNPSNGLWNDRAGGWTYDYDNQGAGASEYNLDAPNAHTTYATTGKNWLPDQPATPNADGSTVTFNFQLAAPVQPSSVIVSVGTKSSVSSGRGSKKKRAQVTVLPFIMDDGNGNIIGPEVSSGSVNYATGVGSITFTAPPDAGDNVTVDSVQLVQTAGAGRCLAIKTASGSDGAAVASQPIPALLNLQPDETSALPTPGVWTVSAWYKASAAISAGVRITAYFGLTADFNVGDAGVKSVDLISNGGATTAWQQVSATVTAPGGALLYLRMVAYHDPDGAGGVTLFFDDFSVKANFSTGSVGPTQAEALPNPSFDFPGAITSNPASHYRDVLQGAANKLALADSRIDLPALQAWWQNNNTNSRFFNGILDNPSTVFDVLQQIAALGRAAFAINDGLYSVVQDQPQTTPVQHFTPRNSWGFKSSRAFPQLPQALSVRWINPNNNWQPDQYIVFDDKPGGGTYDQTSVNLYEGLDLTKGVTDMTQAWKEGRYHLAQARLRPELYQINVDFENLVCQRGDLVLLSHDVPVIGLGAGRVKAQILDPGGVGNLLGVILDESSFVFNYGTSYTMRVRLSATGASMLLPIVNPAPVDGSVQTSTMMLMTPIGVGNTMPQVDDLAMIGELGSETAQMLVVRIEPQKDLTALITLCDYAPDVYTADADPPGGDSQGAPTPFPFAPIIETVNSSDNYSVKGSGGVIIGTIMIHLAPIPTVQTTAGVPVAIQYRTRLNPANDYINEGIYSPTTTYKTSEMVTDANGVEWVCVEDGTVGITPGTDGGTNWTEITDNSPWTVNQIPLSQTVTVNNVQIGGLTDVQLAYVYTDGTISAWTDIASAVQGQVTLPNDPTALTAVVTKKGDLRLRWTAPSPRQKNFDGYEIVTGGVPISSASESAGTATITTSSAHGYAVGDSVIISGVSVPGYNGTVEVLSVPTSTTFTYAPATSGLGAGSGGATIDWTDASVFVDRTKQKQYLITDPADGANLYWVAARDTSGNIDATPPFVSVSFTQQPYTLKTILGADVGPFDSETTIIGPISFTVPPQGGRIHVDWTMIFTNGSTAQAVRGVVVDNTNSLSCAQHRTHGNASMTAGFNGSGHFDHLYGGGDVVSISLICIPGSSDNLTVNAADSGGWSPNPAVTFLDIQFHPSPN